MKIIVTNNTVKHIKKEKKVFTFLLKTESGKETALQVLCEGTNKGVNWDYPRKPNESVVGVQDVLNLFDWIEEDE